MNISKSDTEFQEDSIKSVEALPSGEWSITDSKGWSLFVPNDICAQAPAPGETCRLYGRGIGRPVRGIVIGGRLYRYETAEEHAESQAKARERWAREREEADRKFQESDKPTLAAFQVSDSEGWQACVAANSRDAYSFECTRFAAAWASNMDREIANGATVSDIAKKCAREADTSGLTGFMYGCAVSMLAKFWVHGDKLRRWHNKDVQIGNEGERANETGGVLNPALISVSQRTP
jgi:hypothetical protein